MFCKKLLSHGADGRLLNTVGLCGTIKYETLLSGINLHSWQTDTYSWYISRPQPEMTSDIFLVDKHQWCHGDIFNQYINQSVNTDTPGSLQSHKGCSFENNTLTAWAWNALPQHVRNEPSLSVFHRKLMTVLFRSSFPDVIWQCTVPVACR